MKNLIIEVLEQNDGILLKQQLLYKIKNHSKYDNIVISSIEDINYSFSPFRSDNNELREILDIYISEYSKTFMEVNDVVILFSNKEWNILYRTIKYLIDFLKKFYSNSDLQFIIASLLFLVRVTEERQSIHYYNSILTSFDEMFFGISNIKGFEEIINDSIHLLDKLDHKATNETINILSHVKTLSFSEKIFGRIFEYFIHLMASELTSSMVPVTPLKVRELMVGILNPKKGSLLHDPVCGSGGLLIEAIHSTGESLDVTGCEINIRISQLCKMNLLMNGFEHDKIIRKDFVEYFKNNEKFSCLIADFPLNMKFNKSLRFDFPLILHQNSLKGYVVPISYIISKLNKEGRAVITVPNNFLFTGGNELKLRTVLINKDYIEGVINLPKGAFRPFTEARTSILILNKNKETYLKKKIKFMNCDELLSSNNYWNISNTIDVYKNENVKSNYMKLIDTERLTKDLSLLASSYSTEILLSEEMLTKGTGAKLGDIIEITIGSNVSASEIRSSGKIPIVKNENLNRDILASKIQYNSIKHYVEDYSSKKAIISKECILIARIGDFLKPTLYTPNEDFPVIFIHNGVIAFTAKKEGEILIEYLYYQLNSTFVKNQIERYRVGSTMPHINKSKLVEIVIPLIDIDSQQSFIDSQKASIIATERAKVEERIRALGYQEEVENKESKIVKTLIHQLRPKLAIIDLQVKSIQRIIESNQLQSYTDLTALQADKSEINELLSTTEELTLWEEVVKLKHDTNQINDVLTNVKKIMNYNLTEEDKSDVNLSEFIRSYIDIYHKQGKKQLNFEVKCDNDIIIRISKTAFTELFDQLILNSLVHGYNSEEELKKAKISFTVKDIKSRNVIVIDFRNNGKPYMLDHDDYISVFKKGNSSNGSGIGGNYIYRIVKAHHGNISVKTLTNGFHLSIEIQKRGV